MEHFNFYVKKSGSTEKCFFFKRTFGLSVLLSTAPARFLPQMIAKHLLSSEKMPVKPTTEDNYLTSADNFPTAAQQSNFVCSKVQKSR
jgi:hypothetical protein